MERHNGHSILIEWPVMRGCACHTFHNGYRQVPQERVEVQRIKEKMRISIVRRDVYICNPTRSETYTKRSGSLMPRSRTGLLVRKGAYECGDPYYITQQTPDNGGCSHYYHNEFISDEWIQQGWQWSLKGLTHYEALKLKIPFKPKDEKKSKAQNAGASSMKKQLYCKLRKSSNRSSSPTLDSTHFPFRFPYHPPSHLHFLPTFDIKLHQPALHFPTSFRNSHLSAMKRK